MSTQLPAERLEGQVTSQVVIDAAGIGKTVRVVQTPAQAMVAGTQISIPHGLGAVPDPASIKANLVCVNANNGFNPGDVVDMDAFYIQADTSGGSTGGSNVNTTTFQYIASADDTNLYITVAIAGVIVMNRTTGVAFSMATSVALADWNIIAECREAI